MLTAMTTEMSALEWCAAAAVGAQVESRPCSDGEGVKSGMVVRKSERVRWINIRERETREIEGERENVSEKVGRRE